MCICFKTVNFITFANSEMIKLRNNFLCNHLLFLMLPVSPTFNFMVALFVVLAYLLHPSIFFYRRWMHLIMGQCHPNAGLSTDAQALYTFPFFFFIFVQTSIIGGTASDRVVGK